MKLSFDPGSWPRVGSRALVIFAVSSFALWCFYSHYDPTRDPKTSALIASFVAGFDKFAKWWNGDKDLDALRSIIAERDRTIAELRNGRV